MLVAILGIILIILFLNGLRELFKGGKAAIKGAANAIPHADEQFKNSKKKRTMRVEQEVVNIISDLMFDADQGRIAVLELKDIDSEVLDALGEKLFLIPSNYEWKTNNEVILFKNIDECVDDIKF